MATLTKFVVWYTKSRPTKSSKMEHALSWPTKSADFCMTHDRFLSGDFVGRKNQPILSFVRHSLKFQPLKFKSESSARRAQIWVLLQYALFFIVCCTMIAKVAAPPLSHVTWALLKLLVLDQSQFNK